MIDIGKGLGILLIVIGHSALFSGRHGGLDDFIKAFRLPFFFFISGTTFAIGMRTVRQVAWARADAWLKPYAVVVILAGLLSLMTKAGGGVEAILLGLLFSTGFTLSWTPIWFLPHLWLLYVSAAVLLRHGAVLVCTWPRRVVLLVMIAVAGYALMQQFDSVDENAVCRRIVRFGFDLFDCGLPFSADLLLLTGMFFLLGHFLAARVKAFRLNWSMLALLLAVTVAQDYYFGYTIDFNQRRYDSLLVSTLQAYCGIYIMLSVCSLLSRSAWLTRSLSYLGRGSLFILIFHGSFLLKLETWLARWIHDAYLAGSLAIILSIVIALGLWELTKRSAIASLLMLPRKHSNKLPLAAETKVTAA